MLFQQLCDLLVVGVRVQWFVIVVVVVLVFRGALQPLGLRVLLLLGRGHLRRVPLPPLGPPVLEPHLEGQNICFRHTFLFISLISTFYWSPSNHHKPQADQNKIEKNIV